MISWDFPGSPVVKTLPYNAEGVGSIPGQGVKIPHSSRPKDQNTEQKQCCNEFNKDFTVNSVAFSTFTVWAII